MPFIDKVKATIIGHLLKVTDQGTARGVMSDVCIALLVQCGYRKNAARPLVGVSEFPLVH